jgi:CRP/FNR family cyclic AMP-dependent transcriptional regulator
VCSLRIVGEVASLGSGDFFGEGCPAGQPRRMGTATAMEATTVLRIGKDEMMRTLHEQSALFDRFIPACSPETSGLRRIWSISSSTRVKSDSRTLLLLARYGQDAAPPRPLPRQLFHEQVPKAGIHRVQRRAED